MAVYHPEKSMNNLLLDGPKYKGFQTFWLTLSPFVTVLLPEKSNCANNGDDYASILKAYLDYEKWYEISYICKLRYSII